MPPSYVYRCKQCRETQEQLHKIDEQPKFACESCGAETERIIQATNFTLKGGGWANDRYHKEK